MKEELLYKYRDWENKYHKRILTHNEVYMASPKLFNDPFDCRIFPDYTLLKTEADKDLYIKETLIYFKSIYQDVNYTVDELRKGLDDSLMDPLFNEKQASFEADQHNRNIGIFSTSIEVYSSILMWSHYANNHRGFNVGLSFQKLASSNLFSLGKMVTYEINQPVIHPNDISKIEENTIKQLSFKHKDWEYEKEFRFAISNTEELTEEQRKVIIPDDCIKEINLGLEISPEHREEIISLARQKKINVYQMKKVPNQFKLTRTKI